MLPYRRCKLTPNQSLEEGGFIFVSELILVRIPVAEGDQLLQASTTVPLTGIPQPSQPQPSQPQRRRPPQHHVFVRVATPHPRGFYLEVYPIVSFSCQGGAVSGYNAAPETVKRGLIPLPPLSSTFPTPPRFGDPLHIGGWVNSRDAFLSVDPLELELDRSAKFKKTTPQVTLSYAEMLRIDAFRNQLIADTRLDQGGPSGSGSGNNGGEEPAIPGQNDEEENAGQNDEENGGGSRRTGLRAILCCGGGEQNRTADEAQYGNAIVILPEDDSTDEDGDRSPTMKDDLILLAHSHPSWIPELEKYIAAEMRAVSCLKVESWLQGMD